MNTRCRITGYYILHKFKKTVSFKDKRFYIYKSFERYFIQVIDLRKAISKRII